MLDQHARSMIKKRAATPPIAMDGGYGMNATSDASVAVPWTRDGSTDARAPRALLR